MRPRSLWMAFAGVVALATCAGLAVPAAGAGPASGAAPSGRSAEDPEAPLGRAERVLVFSVPTLAWEDVERGDAPAMAAFLSDALVANLSVRSVTRSTTATDAYATLNAGTRAEGTPLTQLAFVAGTGGSGRVDANGDPIEVPSVAFTVEVPAEVPDAVFEAPVTTPPDPAGQPAPEVAASTPVAEEFARRSGVSPRIGQVFNFGIVSMVQVNDRLLFGAEVGALGDALEDNGTTTAVVANGDHGEGSDVVDFRREASAAVMDGDGLVDRGMVGRKLLTEDVDAPYGTRFDVEEVVASFQEVWQDDSVVLVEASDMVRAEDARVLSTESQATRQRRQAIARSDELFARLTEQVDPTRDAVVLVAPYAEDAGTALTVIGVQAPSVDAAGLLSSGTTRRAGSVQTVDVAPTVLSLLGAEAPSSMEGTPMEPKGTGGAFEDRVAGFVAADAAAHFRDRSVGLASTVFVVAQLVLWALAWLVLTRSRRHSPLAEAFALGVLLWLPATFLAAVAPFHDWGTAAFWAFTVAVAAVATILVWMPTRGAPLDALIATLALIVVFLSVDIAVGGPLQFNTVFGYTPTVAGRFDGMGNPAFAMFAAAAIILAALLAHRIGGRRGAWVGIALLAWAVVLDASPFLGADVGGALTMVPAAGVTAWMLLGLRVRVRTALLWGLGAVAVVVGLGFVDLARPASQRTHLGRLIADVRDNGLEALQTVVLRKLDSNLSVLLSSVWTLMVAVVFVAIGLLMWRSPGRLRTIRERIPEERAAVAGLLTAMVLGFALNDSGIAVPGIMLGVVSASLVHLVLRLERIPAAEDADGPTADRPVDEPDRPADQLPAGAQSALR